VVKTKKTKISNIKAHKQEEISFNRIFEIFSVLMVALIVVMIIFAGVYYGFSVIKKNVGANANVIASEESKADSIFIPVMLVVFIILMIFILVQVLRLYKQIRGIKDDILEQ